MRAYDLEVTGSLKVQGDIKAENYIVETTVTSMTQSFASGSSKFGDGALDTHQFTGSLFVSASKLQITKNPLAHSLDGNSMVIAENTDFSFFQTIGASRGGILFGDAASASPGYIIYDHSGGNANQMRFATNDGTVGLTIDGSQNTILGGNISGSSTSTGSFGDIEAHNSIRANRRIVINDDNIGNQAKLLVYGGSSNTYPVYITSDQSSGANVTINQESAVNSTGLILQTSAGNNVGQELVWSAGGTNSSIRGVRGSASYGGLGLLKFQSLHNSVLTDILYLGNYKQQSTTYDDVHPSFQLLSGSLEVVNGNISGSSTSTGSFGAGFFDGQVGIGDAVGDIGASHKLSVKATQKYAAVFRSYSSLGSSSQRSMIQIGTRQAKGVAVYFNGPVNSNSDYMVGVKDDTKFHIAPGLNDIADSSTKSVIVDKDGNFEVTAGDISGSSTSTGSFGNLAVLDSNQGTKLGSNAINISTDGVTSRNNLAISIQGNGKLGMNMHEDGGFRSAVYFDHATDDALRFELGGGHSFVMPRTKNEFSGSSTSTGSFGSLIVADNIQGITNEGGLLSSGGDVELRGRLAGSNSVVIGSSAYKLGTAGDRVVVIGENAAGFNSMNGAVDDTVLIGYRAGANVTSNYYNVAIGSNALYSNKTGNSNIAIGYRALYTEGSRGNNVAIGHQALQSQSGSSAINADNVAIGYAAAEDATTATRMVIIGSNAGKDITTGGSHTMVGWRAGFTNTTGTANTFIGNYSGYTNLTGYSNTAVGGSSFYYNSTGYESVAVGLNAGYMFGRGSHTPHSSVFVGNNSGYYATGSYNTFVGKDAGKGGTTGTPYSSGGSNTAVGYQALDAFTTGTQNVAIGYQAGTDLTTGYYNVFAGMSAGQNITIGNSNIILGWQAGNNLTTTDNSIMIGYRAGYVDRGTNDYDIIIGYEAGLKVTGGSNVGIGRDALRGTGGSEFDAISTAAENTAVGYGAASLIIGSQTTAFGYQAGGAATGSRGVYVGYRAGRGATSAPYGSGLYNTAVGYEALEDFTTGHSNVAVGYGAGKDITTSHYNVLVGYEAGKSITTGTGRSVLIGTFAGDAQTTSDYNVAIGYLALTDNQVGSDNVAIGGAAGGDLLGPENVIVGTYAGDALTTSSGSVVIGNNALTTATTDKYGVAIGFEAMKLSPAGLALETTIAIGYRAMYGAQATSGISGNVAIGSSAGYTITSGGNNVFLGYHAAYNVTAGSKNVIVGRHAGNKLASGSSDTYIGYSAGYYATGSYNTFVGESAGLGGTTSAPFSSGENNVAIGYEALKSFTTADKCVAIGSGAGKAHQTAAWGVYIGYEAGNDVTTGAQNVLIGGDAGAKITTADRNIAIGGAALQTATTGGSNTVVGDNAGWSATTASGSVFMGRLAGGNIDSANANVAIGQQALENVDAGSDGNVAVGYKAGNAHTNAGNEGSVYIGHKAGQGIVNSQVTMIGWEAGAGYSGIGKGEGTTLIGHRSGYLSNDDAINNTAVGFATLYANTAGERNTVMGRSAGFEITTGDNNTLIGYNTQGPLTGNKNTAIGAGAMQDVDAGSTSGGSSNNTFVGFEAGGGTWANVACNNNTAVGNNAMDAALNGALYNTALGSLALGALTEGDNNVAIGYQAGDALTTGGDNTIVGTEAGTATTAASRLVMIGYGAGRNGNITTDGSGCIGIGQYALQDLTSGGRNVVIGSYAGKEITTAPDNTLVGNQAGMDLTFGKENTFIGSDAGANATTASGSTAIGYKAMGSYATTGIDNTVVGKQAAPNIISGEKNTILGGNSAGGLIEGRANVSIGHYSMGAIQRYVSDSVVVGNNALAYHGAQCVAIGGSALHGDSTYGGTAAAANHTGSVAVGYQAGASTTGSYNTFVGYQAGKGASAASGENNVAVGKNALVAFTTGYDNVAVGRGAGDSVTTGINNVIIGSRAGEAMSATNNCVIIGRAAGLSINSTDANHSTLVGSSAGQSITDGQNNTALGFYSMFTNSTSDQNVAVGYKALEDHNVTGTGANTMVGYEAGKDITTGQYNTGLGSAVVFDADANNQTAIGRGATTDSANDIAIGNTSVDEIKGQVDFSTFSDRRIKKNIKDNDLGLDFVNDLRPRKFNKVNPAEYPDEIRKANDGNHGEWTDSQANKVWDGLIAQEVKEAVDKHKSSFSGWNVEKNSKENITYSTLTIPLIKAVQELSKKVEELEAKISGSI